MVHWPRECKLLFSDGMWRCYTDFDGIRFYGTGITVTQALQNLELQILGIPVVYVVHMDLKLD